MWMPTNERSTTVIDDLFSTMNGVVDAYDENAKRIRGRVNGTSFFPGGIGLWRGLNPQGPILDDFPVKPIMFLGHNFDNEDGFNRSKHNRIEPLNTGTWKGQQIYMNMADINPPDCFFTNFYTALQPGSSVGEMLASETLKKQCTQFCEYQIERTDPCLIAVMGKFVPDLFTHVKHSVHCIEIDHPAYPVRRGTVLGKPIFEHNANKLRKALETVGYYARKSQ
jgi:hypothetical protein